MMRADLQPVDVICQHSRDGTLMPMRVRVVDDDGQYQTYTIKGYRDISHQGTRELPNGVYVTNRTYVYECQIFSFGKQQIITLYYEPNGTVWRMSAS